MRTIRASEIGVYVFCQRAWWYARAGLPSENITEIAAGNEIHSAHRRQVWNVGCLKVIAAVVLLLSLALIIIYLSGRLF
jgi:CRISPR/Cas system-associated exonuclease Cas4 (RecB family)